MCIKYQDTHIAFPRGRKSTHILPFTMTSCANTCIYACTGPCIYNIIHVKMHVSKVRMSLYNIHMHKIVVKVQVTDG